jgi:hypothetical protein
MSGRAGGRTPTVIPGHRAAMSFDAQLRIRESNHDRRYGFRACASESAVADLDNDVAELRQTRLAQPRCAIAHRGMTKLSSAGFAGYVRNRGIFVVRVRCLICDDVLRFASRETTWRCSFGRTANIATRIFRQIQRKPASVVMNAPSVRIASRTSSTMCARTAAAGSRPGRSDQRPNGARRVRRQAPAVERAGSPILWARRHGKAFGAHPGYPAGRALKASD